MRHGMGGALALLVALLLAACVGTTPVADREAERVRVATFNVALFADRPDAVRQRLAGGGDAALRDLAAIIQRQRPDVLLLNEVDFDEAGALADVLQREYLEVGQHGEASIRYAHRFLAPVNTGVPSGMDLNGDGEVGGAGRKHGEDAFGFGLHPGQYGMLVLSRYPIDAAAVRTFQMLPWSTLPDARRPKHPDGRWWYDDTVWPKLRLSSKSHWDVPVQTPLGVVHLLASHPTPPAFDGPEDRNGSRNADELLLWRHYLDNRDAGWPCDDQGRCGGLPEAARFVIAGDLNNDPVDGSGHHDAIKALIEHPRVLRHDFPRSEGGVASAKARGGVNLQHRGDPALDTSQFGPTSSGNLHLDYVMPSVGFRIVDSGVYWPAPGQPGAAWADSSDHRMVWLDLALEEAGK